MQLTAFAAWLNSFFYSFDQMILSCYRNAAVQGGDFFTPLMVFISYFGYKGIFSIVLCLILLLFRKTRKSGICALIAIAVGALICNVILKPWVARPRPYTISPYDKWWEFTGAHAENDMSFPSGHVNIITATVFGIFFGSEKKQFTWPVLIAPVVMAASRNYLMVHYPSDVMFGMLTGLMSAVISQVAVFYIFRALERNKENSVCKWILEADLIKFVTSRRSRS